jgi:hypothetical protein
MFGTARKIGLVALAFSVLTVSSASAASTYYVSPTGTAAVETGCVPLAPCDLPTTVNASALVDGDEVVLLPGTYTLTSPLSISKALTVRGTVSPADTVITSNLTAPIVIDNSGATLGRVKVDSTNSSNLAGVSLNHGTLERSIVVSQSAMGCNVLDGKISDTICVAHAAGSSGYHGAGIASSFATSGLTASLTLRNVTAIGKGSSYSDGLFVRTDGGAGSVVVNARASIFLGGPGGIASNSRDVFGTNVGGTAVITTGLSNYSTTGSSGSFVSITASPLTGAKNVAGPITFVDAANDDYHLSRSTLSAIDLGGEPAGDGSSGTTDVDAEQRKQGVAIDIGADEIDNVGPAAPTLFGSVDRSQVGFTGQSESISLVHVTEDGADVCAATSDLRGSFFCMIGGITNGVHTYRAYADDFLGNKSAPSRDVTVTINVDYEKPVLKKRSVKTKSRKTTIKFTANEAATFTCKLDKGKVKTCKSPYKTKKLKKGKHKLVVTATDTAGLVSKPLTIKWTVK